MRGVSKDRRKHRVPPAAFRGALDYATFEWKLKEAQPNFNAAMKALNSGYGHLAK